MKLNSQRLVKSLVFFVVLGAALGLAQLWLDIFSAIVFGKIMTTLIVLGAVVSFIIAVREDLSGEEKLRDDKFLN